MIFKKTYAFIQWFFNIAIISIAFGGITSLLLIAKIWINIPWVVILSSLVFTSWIMYPILYPYRDLIRNIKPFWYYFDDEDGDYGSAKFRAGKGLKDGVFKTAWLWSASRNPMWNLQASITSPVIDSTPTVVSSKGLLQKNSKVVSIMNMAVFKYVDENGQYLDNFGTLLSLKHSILGTSFVWFEVDGKLYWRKSFAGKGFLGLWWEVQLGVSDTRYTLRIKPYKTKEIYEEKSM